MKEQENANKKTFISVVNYDKETYSEVEIKDIQELTKHLDKNQNTWIDIRGYLDFEAIKQVGESFKLHPLVVEDILNSSEHSKIYSMEDYVFVIINNFTYNKKNHELNKEQINVILNASTLLTFQEKNNVYLNSIKRKASNNEGRLRKMNIDFLLYSIIDITIDNYLSVMDKINDDIEILEASLIEDPTDATLKSIYKLKSEIMKMKKEVWHLFESITKFSKNEVDFIGNEIQIFFKDLHDHLIKVMDSLEMYREMISSLLELYMSMMSNKMNTVMKTMSTISTIFLPLTFITSIYGMNFQFMPELNLPFGYPAILGLILLVSGGMIIYFKRKKWF